jgi:hypothetical protein
MDELFNTLTYLVVVAFVGGGTIGLIAGAISVLGGGDYRLLAASAGFLVGGSMIARWRAHHRKSSK